MVWFALGLDIYFVLYLCKNYFELFIFVIFHFLIPKLLTCTFHVLFGLNIMCVGVCIGMFNMSYTNHIDPQPFCWYTFTVRIHYICLWIIFWYQSKCLNRTCACSDCNDVGRITVCNIIAHIYRYRFGYGSFVVSFFSFV